MRKFVLCFGVAALLAGCQTSSNPYAEANRQLNEAQARSVQIAAECNANAAQFRTYFAYQQCFNGGYAVLASAMDAPTAAGLRWRMAQMLVLAEKFDKKQISSTQFDVASAEILAESLAISKRLSTGHSRY